MNNVVNGIPSYNSRHRFKFDAINIRRDKRSLPLKTTSLTMCLHSIDEITVIESEHRSFDKNVLNVFGKTLYYIKYSEIGPSRFTCVFISRFGIKINPFYQVQTGPYAIRYT